MVVLWSTTMVIYTVVEKPSFQMESHLQNMVMGIRSIAQISIQTDRALKFSPALKAEQVHHMEQHSEMQLRTSQLQAPIRSTPEQIPAVVSSVISILK